MTGAPDPLDGLLGQLLQLGHPGQIVWCHLLLQTVQPACQSDQGLGGIVVQFACQASAFVFLHACDRGRVVTQLLLSLQGLSEHLRLLAETDAQQDQPVDHQQRYQEDQPGQFAEADIKEIGDRDQ